MTKIEVTIDVKEGKLAVWNNGKGIPCVIHKVYGVYVPELIFGHLLTSSNYNDAEKKVVGGRNGFGAKLANIFSKKFIIEAADSKNKKLFTQTYEDNMKKRGEPEIKTYEGKEDYTFVTFYPDLKRFGMKKLDSDTVRALSKRVYDVAGVLPSKVEVYLNGKEIKINNFETYIDFYLEGAEIIKIYEKVNNRWEIGVSVSDGQFQQVSFVNGICTIKGGTHVNHVADQIVECLSEAIKKKHKLELKPHQIKSHIWIFVNALIENPAFDSQTKETLTLKPSSFGSTCNISQAALKKILKCGIVEVLVAVAQAKDKANLLKHLNGGKEKKENRLLGIDKLEDANWAGTKRSNECMLIVTEGDSAKSLAMVGIEVIGRDKYGVFPIRGKLLNVRNANNTMIGENAEIQDLIRILGLKVGKEYHSTKDLRYGGLMIMADQDHDGSHIKGLIVSFIHTFWPSLWKLPGFLSQFITPIIKVSKGQEVHQFFTIPEYEKWVENKSLTGYKVKYYKGLGTSTSREAKEYFKSIEKHKINFNYIDETDEKAIVMAFSKKNVEQRKDWLTNYREGIFVDYSSRIVRYKDFVDKELILYSMYDNVRSIPSVCDGLKPAQRKVLYACFKRNLKTEIKVAQLTGYVAEHTSYHHGEDSLAQTIIGMAQNFAGSNNINLLQPIGQFGTRYMGGKEAASPRYLYTSLAKITRKIFREEDEPLLKYQIDEGQKVEPEYYLPILPMILVNGSEGIGSGWRSAIPNHNPRELVECIKRKMRGETIGQVLPWFNNYTGKIIEGEESSGFVCYGRYEILNDYTIQIDELPIKKWTKDYKLFLEEITEGYEKVLAKKESTKKKSKKGKKQTTSTKRKEPSTRKRVRRKRSSDEEESGSDWEDKKPNITSEDISSKEIKIDDIKEYHEENRIKFILTMKTEYIELLKKKKMEEDGNNKFMKALKLVSTIPKTQFVCFDSNGNIKRYKDANEIIDEYYLARLNLYKKRKVYQIEELKRELAVLDNKVRFITEIINGSLNLFRQKKAVLAEILHSKGYAKGSDLKDKVSVEEKLLARLDIDEEVVKVSEYDYLLGMPLWTLTEEKIVDLESQKAQKEAQIKELEEYTELQIWEKELDEFIASLDKIECSEARTEKVSNKITQEMKGKNGRSKMTDIRTKRESHKKITSNLIPLRPKTVNIAKTEELEIKSREILNDYLKVPKVETETLSVLNNQSMEDIKQPIIKRRRLIISDDEN